MGLETIVVLLSVALSEEVDVDAIKVTWYVSPFSLSRKLVLNSSVARVHTCVYPCARGSVRCVHGVKKAMTGGCRVGSRVISLI